MSDPVAQVLGPTWLYVADTHNATNLHQERLRIGLDLARAAVGSFEGLLHAGDATVAFLPWWYDSEGGNAGSGDQVVQAPGNHDTETELGEEPPADPFATFKASYPWFNEGREFARVSVGPVSIYILNTCDDVLYNGMSQYGNCNPPGIPDSCNPSFGGILDPESEQRQWLAAELAADEHLWKVALMHRPPAAPYANNYRPVFDALLPVLTSMGFSIADCGDIHMGSLCGPFDGMYTATLAGGYVVRQANLGVLDSSLVKWASGGTQTSGLVHVAAQTFGEDAMLHRVWEVSNAQPQGALVCSVVLPRNAG